MSKKFFFENYLNHITKLNVKKMGGEFDFLIS